MILLWNTWCWLYMMILLHDDGYIDEHDVGVNCYIWWWLSMMMYIVYESIAYDLLSCLLGWVMGCHIIISLVGLGTWLLVRVLICLCVYKLLNLLSWHSSYVELYWLWTWLLLLWSLCCICSLICALKAIN